jgi:tripartite ATP-independent transporter DctM subunit
METAGLWMLAAVALLMVATGLPTWMLLLGVASAAAATGVALGAFAWPVLTALPARLLGLLENDLLQALPLYVFMGALLNRLPLADILFRDAAYLARRSGAGTALAGLGLGVLLAPMNGSVGASVSMLARTVQPRLDQSGMSAERSAALVAVSGALGALVPPSLVLILLGSAMLNAHTEAVNAATGAARAVRIINTQDVFRGALLPAALLVALWLLVAVRANRRASSVLPQPGPAAPSRGDWLAGAVTLLLVGGLLAAVTLGYLYAVEGAACGAALLFGFGLATRRLGRDALWGVLEDTMSVTGTLFALLIGATVFTLVLRLFETDRWIAALLNGLHGGPWAALALVLAILGLAAFVLDAFELIFVVIPVVMPPLLAQVPDAVWVAVLALLVLQASFLLPPFGYAFMMVRNRSARPPGTWAFARALAPYLAAQLCVLALVLAFPALVWRDAPASAPAHSLSDGEVRDLLNRQVEEGDPASQGGSNQ